MELIVKNYKAVEKIDFNYEEIKQELVKKLDNYKGVTYTEESLKLAKEDRAELNKIAKSLNAKRLELEKEYMIPFNAFKDKVKELINLTNETSSEIDSQVKAFEEKQREQKILVISNIIQELNKNNYPIDIEEKYLLKSATEKSIKEDIERKIAKFDEDLQILKDMQPVDFEDIKRYYFRIDGNLSESIKELNRIKEIANKVEEKFKDVEKPVILKAEEKEEVEEFNLTVFCTKKQFEQLKMFLQNQNIKSL